MMNFRFPALSRQIGQALDGIGCGSEMGHEFAPCDRPDMLGADQAQSVTPLGLGYGFGFHERQDGPGVTGWST